MSSSPEMSVYNLRIKQGLLDCAYCRQPLRPDTSLGKAYKCAAVHIFCRACINRHEPCTSFCDELDRIISKMKFKCNCCDFLYTAHKEIEGHLCDVDMLVHHEFYAVPDRGECIIDTSALLCSECGLPLRPPIFRHLPGNMLVCSACYDCGDIANYRHCHELDYLVEGVSVECEACKEYLPFSTLASHQLDDCSFKQTLPKVAPGSRVLNNLLGRPPPPQGPPMSSSPEMSVFNLRISQGLLDCKYCHRPLQPDTYGGRSLKCAGNHIFCRECDADHRRACISRCGLMDDIIIQMKFKSNCCDSGRKYTPYCEFIGHLCDTPGHHLVEQQLKSVCILDTSALVCSDCQLPLRPPIFRNLLGNMLVCSACYHHGGITKYRHCPELDYLVKGISVECEACKEYLPFPTLASHQLDDCSFKQTLLRIGPGSRARKNVCDEEETERPSIGSNSIHGKHKRTPPLEVGKMDKHIVHSDESWNDDDPCDDKHPETVKRVAENAFKTPCEKAEVATPYGQKTAQAPSKPPLPMFVPRRPVTRSRKRVLLTDGSTSDK